jgi:hypothetical protein
MNIVNPLPMPKYEYQKEDNRIGNANYGSVGTLRDKVFQAEAIMKEMPSAIHLTKLFHYFAPGIYARELHIPAGITLTGKIHKYPQLNILSKGKISVLTEDGIKDVEAPFTVVSPAGTKRIAYAHTDCVWTTILNTSLKDVDAIEKEFTTDDENEWLEFNNSGQLKLEF